MNGCSAKTSGRGALLAAICWACLSTVPVLAQTEKPPKEDPVHNELRAFREKAVDAFKKRDVDRFMECLHPDVVLMWEDNQVEVGKDGVRKYLDRMMNGPNAVVESMTTEGFEVDDMSKLFNGGNTAVSHGHYLNRFKLRDGRQFTLNSRWTVTMVKEGDRWLITSGHASINPFDNDVLNLAVRTTAWWVGGGAAVGGLLLGIVGTVLVRRWRKPA
jgi:ketosteroid isomerase-like protein